MKQILAILALIGIGALIYGGKLSMDKYIDSRLKPATVEDEFQRLNGEL